jgi:hypothetical protein
MISAQVSLSAIFLAASANIYSSESNFEQKSLSAQQLDEELTVWKSRLPQWLNPDVLSFTEPEWISKQKLALQIRKIDSLYRYGLLTFKGFYQIRAFIHRPFLSTTSASGKFDYPVSLCLLVGERRSIFSTLPSPIAITSRAGGIMQHTFSTRKPFFTPDLA